MAESPLVARTSPVSVWTGRELVVWSGLPATSDECVTDAGGGSLCGEPAVFDGAAYDPSTDRWRMIARGPVPAAGAPTQVIPQGVWTGTEMVVWGGWGDPIAAAYEPATDTWRDLPPGPLSAREQHAVVAWDGRVVVLGGREPLGPGELAPRLDGAVLDPASGKWTMLPELPAGDPFMAPGIVAATVADGRLFAVRAVTTDAYVLDPGSTAWNPLGSAGVNGFLEPVGVAGGQWLFVGSGDEGTTTAAAFDLVNGTWRQIAAPAGVSTLGLMGADAGTRVVAVAARWSHEPDPPLALAWDPTSDTWSELATPSLEHRFGAAVGWTGNELLVWGGANTGGLGGPSYADGAALGI
ncbi:MAG: hypothetical protein ABW328_00780 [Ilumatobacteraceae bacterium]